MLELNIVNLLKTRGVDNASRYLVQKGMKYHTVNRLLTGKVDGMTYATLEQLCLFCNCSPDDLFVWRKADGLDVPDDHSLYKLKPKENVISPVDRIKNLPVSKLAKLQEFMDGLEKGEVFVYGWGVKPLN